MSKSGSTTEGVSKAYRDDCEAIVAQNDPKLVVNNPESYEEATEPFTAYDATAYSLFAVEAKQARYITAKIRIGDDEIAGIKDVSGEEVSFRIEEIDRIEYYGDGPDTDA